ncbi:uncharacterized protein LOC100119111 [Nasonia vitripennis]|uniref:F-box domain-containing protein n=1 Tax=Nasonia vitripennis TaxID=7425 RepID=A0A7M7QKC0_NASVI|nr:uncharacterized protein LOC100119111 [Nasonia vitripennis]XP_031787680.1 uncharacterized protein LOC100119111 [Nasonia vitripennis]
MEKPSNKEEEISAEFALSDALDNICQYFKIRDLINVSLVCKSWQETAKREIAKRGPERVLIPHIYCSDIRNGNSSFHVYDFLSAEPYVAILFVGPSLRERNNERILEFKILRAYKKYFPHHLIAVGVDESMMDEEIINSCPGMLGAPNGILGLFLPKHRDLTIKVASCIYNRSASYAEKIIEDISPDDKQLKSTLIIFCNSYQGYSLATQVLKHIKKRFVQKMYTLWGGVFDDDLKAIDCPTVDSIDNPKTAIFALSITGSNLESWSVVIDCRIKKQEVNEKLFYLRDNLRLRRRTIGLACGPRYVEDLSKNSHENMYLNSHELMHVIKKIFSRIPFISIFNYGYHSHFGVDSISDDGKQELAHQMAISLMILTYD